MRLGLQTAGAGDQKRTTAMTLTQAGAGISSLHSREDNPDVLYEDDEGEEAEDPEVVERQRLLDELDAEIELHDLRKPFWSLEVKSNIEPLKSKAETDRRWFQRSFDLHYVHDQIEFEPVDTGDIYAFMETDEYKAMRAAGVDQDMQEAQAEVEKKSRFGLDVLRRGGIITPAAGSVESEEYLTLKQSLRARQKYQRELQSLNQKPS
jgi:hypothetical protein